MLGDQLPRPDVKAAYILFMLACRSGEAGQRHSFAPYPRFYILALVKLFFWKLVAELRKLAWSLYADLAREV